MLRKSSACLALFFLLLALAACAGKKVLKPGDFYRVYGGSKILSGDAGWEPLRHGYRLLGGASGNQNFYGAYPLYLILVEGGNVLRLDAVQFSDGSFLEMNHVARQNVLDLAQARGMPDMKAALVGVSKEGGYDGGYLLLAPRARENRSITIFVAE